MFRRDLLKSPEDNRDICDLINDGKCYLLLIVLKLQCPWSHFLFKLSDFMFNKICKCTVYRRFLLLPENIFCPRNCLWKLLKLIKSLTWINWLSNKLNQSWTYKCMKCSYRKCWSTLPRWTSKQMFLNNFQIS